MSSAKKKTIWVWNHYAANMYTNRGGRHYWFAENLRNQGYDVKIFCANTIHNSTEVIEIDRGIYTMKSTDGIPFIFVKVPSYVGNGKQRIKNMITFYRNLFPVSKEYAKVNGKPDVILASSVHPLTLVAGIKIAKKFGIPCICEVRDLWPESIVEYGQVKRNSIITELLYRGEKWIYKKANALIFTMEGGKDYIIEQGWDKEHGGPIDLKKVSHINNGVDLQQFDMNFKEYQIEDEDLKNPNLFKVIYTGSIRKVNRVEELVKVAETLHNKNIDNIKFLIWGTGDYVEEVTKQIAEKQLKNICLKGRVEKHYIPYILSKSDLNIYFLKNSPLYRFGISLNKSFEYFASGKPVLASANSGYSIIDKYACGKCLGEYSVETLAKEVMAFYEMNSEEYMKCCINSRAVAKDYDFRKLTDKLISLIEGL